MEQKPKKKEIEIYRKIDFAKLLFWLIISILLILIVNKIAHNICLYIIIIFIYCLIFRYYYFRFLSVKYLKRNIKKYNRKIKNMQGELSKYTYIHHQTIKLDNLALMCDSQRYYHDLLYKFGSDLEKDNIKNLLHYILSFRWLWLW